jgi:hypothetical protein
MDATLARRKKEERKPARKPREAEPAPASTPEPEHAPAAGVPLFLRRAPASSAPAPASAGDTAAATLGEVAVAPADDALEREAESIAQAVAAAAPAVTTPPAASAPPPASPDAARVSKTYKKASASPDPTSGSTAERASTPRKKAPAPADQASAPSAARVSKTYKKAPAAPDQPAASGGERVSKADKNQPAAEPEQTSRTHNHPPAAASVRAYKTYKNAPPAQSAPASSTVPAFLRRTSSAVSAAGLGTADAEQEREAGTGAQPRAAGASASAATPPRDAGLYKTYKNDAGGQSASAGSTTPAYLRRATSAAPEASSRAETHQPSRKLFASRVTSLGEPSAAVGLAEAQDAIQSADPSSGLTAASGAAGSAGAGSGAGDAGADDAPPPLLAEAEGAAAGSASGAAGGSAGGDAGDGDAADASASALAADVARDALPFAPLPIYTRTNALTHSRTSVPHSRTSPGDPLPDVVRSILEAILGVDLAGVRIHKQPEDREAARELDARAFALGGDIWLGPGESDHDVRLMAHEVAHVLQGDHLLRRAPATAAKKPKSKDKKEKKDKKPKAGDASTGTGGAAAASAAPAPAASGGDAVSVPLLMPEPPADLSANARARIREVKSESRDAAEAQADMPPAEAVTDGTRAAVAEPAAEAAGRAQGEVVEELDAAPEPSPEIEELCKKIYAVIKGKRPPDEDKLVEAKPEEMAKDAGGQLDGNVRGDTERVQGGYDAIGETPAGEPAPAQQDLETPPASTDAPAVHATQAVPDAVPAEKVSLDADVEAGAAKMEDAGMNKEPAQLVESGPIAEAREAQGELVAKAAEDPAKVMAAQSEARGKAAEDMAALQARALATLRGARKETAGGVGTQQGTMVKQEAVTRESVGIKAKGIFTKAQKDVRDLLKPLPTTAMERWNTEKAILSQEFKDSLAKVKRWIDKRHEGIGGSILSGADYLFGLPKWVTREYDQAEKKFGDGVCRVIRQISIEVNRVILACEAIVEQANKEIAKLYTDLPEDLLEWAAGEKKRFAEQLDGLKNEARTTRDTFNKDLVQRAGTAVQEVREEIHKLRQEAGGLVGRLIDAVGRFLDDPVKFIIEGLLELVGIPPASFWALVNRISQVIEDIADNPLGFANNLLSGIAQGFDRFFGAIGKHLVGGFFDWLFSGLGSVGVQIPSDFSLKGIVTFALQLMGITWDRVRRLLAKHIGEKNVALLEKAYELVAGLMEKGPEGIFEMIKDKLDPRMIIDQVIQAGIEFLTEALIKNVSARIVLLFNPAGAIVQALEAIYRVLKWVFENAARLFSFVETVVNGMAQVVAGNISGMAAAVEGALAKLIAPVIDFLADYIGMGDLPEKIAEVIKGFQGWVEGILDTVIGFLAKKAKDLLKSLGLAGEEKPAGEQEGDGEIGETVRFSAGGEGHRLWVQATGANPTLMVASTPGPVERRLEAWDSRVDTELPVRPAVADGPTRASTRRLLGDARVLLGQADKDADEAVREAIGRHQKPPRKRASADEVLEARQHALATVLEKLFDIFGKRGKDKMMEEAEMVADIAASLPGHTEAFRGVVHTHWLGHQIGKPKLTQGPPPQALWDNAVLTGTEKAAAAYVRRMAVHESLTTYFKGATDRRGGSAAQAFYAWAFTAGTPPLKRAVLGELGTAAVPQLQKTARSAVRGSGLDAAEKKELLDEIDNIGYKADAHPYGKFTLPSTEEGEHSRFMPNIIQTWEDANTRFIKYDTVSGQTFTVTEDKKTGLESVVTGRKLRLFTGRGVTQDSPHFRKDMNFNRAHIIANEFGGSGYRDSLNLATTSDHYNKKVMRGAELEIGEMVEDFAFANGMEWHEVEFDMDVTVTFGELDDGHVLRLVKKKLRLPDRRDLAAEIERKIRQGKIDPDLKRVVKVVYTVLGMRAGRKKAGKQAPIVIKEDVWLLFK